MERLFALAIIILIIVGFVSYIVNIFNRLVMMKNNVEKSFANIDVLLKQRADEIPNLIKVVKETIKYESGVLEKLTSLRTQYIGTSDTNAKIGLSNEIGNALKSVFAVSENYPDLKANSSFLKLQSRISQLEDHIADRREFYNESVNMYNISIAEFPNFILAKPLGYEVKQMLQISEEEKKYYGVQF